jgi:hypothetical protein
MLITIIQVLCLRNKKTTCKGEMGDGWTRKHPALLWGKSAGRGWAVSGLVTDSRTGTDGKTPCAPLGQVCRTMIIKIRSAFPPNNANLQRPPGFAGQH